MDCSICARVSERKSGIKWTTNMSALFPNDDVITLIKDDDLGMKNEMKKYDEL